MNTLEPGKIMRAGILAFASMLLATGFASAGVARAMAESTAVRCEAKTAGIEADHLRCVARCRDFGQDGACEAKCEQTRQTKWARLERHDGCTPVAGLFEEIAPHESAAHLGCRALEKSRIRSYLQCYSRCERRAETGGSREQAEECTGSCGERLSDRLDSVRRARACRSADPSPTDLATPQLFTKKSTVWKNPEIEVCWINPKKRHARQRGLVRSAVARTWEAVSNVDFKGWGKCSRRDRFLTKGPIKIRIEDKRPGTTGLGSELRGVTQRMRLNFSYEKFDPDCRNRFDFCVSATAVHEFGHALGFSHEQNRPDHPDDCKEQDGTDKHTPIGPWDDYSVMNYCGHYWNNNGRLSATDVAGVQKLYGASHLMTYERRGNRPGRDYRSFEPRPPTPGGCADACRADPRCAAWTYVNAGLQGPNARCWLKSSVSPLSANPNTASGVRAPVEARTDRPGGDFQSLVMAADAVPEACRQACLGNSRCQAWTYVDAGVQRERPVCWLKDHVPAARSNTHTTSGFVGVERYEGNGDVQIDQPWLGAYRLDWCSSWAAGCGQDAAHLYCESHFGRGAFAATFEIAPDIGQVTPTQTPVDRKVCDQSFCDGFRTITCRPPVAPVN